MNNRYLVIFFGMISLSVYADTEVEIPLLKLVEMKYNDVDKSSKPQVMMRQFEYNSSASPEELLKFYQNNEHTASCEYNDMADNYICKLAKHGKVSSGHVFIPTKSKNGVTEIFADYFYFK